MLKSYMQGSVMEISSSQESLEEVRRAMELFELNDDIDTSHSNILPLPSGFASAEPSMPGYNTLSNATEVTFQQSSSRVDTAKFTDMECISLSNEHEDKVVELDSFDDCASEHSADWEAVDKNDLCGRNDNEWILIPEEMEDEITKIKKQIPSVIMADPSFKAIFKTFADKYKVGEKVENVKFAAGILALVAKAGAEMASEPVIEWADNVMRKNMDISVSEFSSSIYCQFVSLFPECTRKLLLTHPRQTFGRGGFVELAVDMVKDESLINL